MRRLAKWWLEELVIWLIVLYVLWERDMTPEAKKGVQFWFFAAMLVFILKFLGG